ncbi:hypothetical protein DFH11DRAFT_1470569, partial [Phellopilus nigrolimitatus]
MEKSYFSRLPQELIREVFQNCLPQKSSFSPNDAPVVLTHVCKAWRAISLHDQQLWSRIEVPNWQESGAHIGELVKLWVERSGAAELQVNIGMFDQDIQMFPGPEKTKELYDCLEGMLATLAPHRARVRRFRGVFPESLMAAVGVDEMVNAEQIFYCGTLDNSGEVDSQLKLYLGPPRNNMRSLAICGCLADLDSVKTQTQLEHLELLDLSDGGDLCQETAIEILQGLPNLKTAVMDITRQARHGFSPPGERIFLNKLETFFVTWCLPANVDLLLDSIITPNLSKLGLRGKPHTVLRQWSNLYSFLNASQAPIKRISLGDFGDTDIRLLDCLENTQELEHLTINHTVIPDAMFRGLTITDEVRETRLLPSLETFNIGVCTGFSAESVVDFLKSRTKDVPCAGFSKLEEIAIMYCSSITESHRELLLSCGIKKLLLELPED